MHCGSKEKQRKYSLIKITLKKDAKYSVTDFSELDIDLANNERNTYKEILSLDEISTSQTHDGEKNPPKNPKPHKEPNVIRPRHRGYYI